MNITQALHTLLLITLIMPNIALSQPVQESSSFKQKLKQTQQWLLHHKALTCGIAAGIIIPVAIIAGIYRYQTKDYRSIMGQLNNFNKPLANTIDRQISKHITQEESSKILQITCGADVLPTSFIRTLVVDCKADVNYGKELYALDQALQTYLDLQSNFERLTLTNDAYNANFVSQRIIQQVQSIKYLLQLGARCNNRHYQNQLKQEKALAYKEITTIFDEHYLPKIQGHLRAMQSDDAKQLLVLAQEPGRLTELLWDACLSGAITVELAQLLIDAGAHIHETTYADNRTALDNIVAQYLTNSSGPQDWFDVIKLLIEHHAQMVTQKDNALNDPVLKLLLQPSQNA